MERNDRHVIVHPIDQREIATTPSVTPKRPWHSPSIEQLTLFGTGFENGPVDDGDGEEFSNG
jgi:hypothetical protein